MSHKIHVLHLRDSSGIYGAERVILTLGRNIDQRRFKFSLLCMSRSDASNRELIAAAHSLGIKVNQIGVEGRLNLRSVVGIRGFLKRNKVDIIHTHDFKSDFYGFMATVFLPIRRIATAHGSTRDSRIKRIYLFLAEKIFYRYFDKILAVSDDLKKFLIGRKVPYPKIEMIRNGFDFHVLANDTTPDNLELDFDPSDYRVFGIVGRLFPDKGHDFFLEAFKSVKEIHINIKALIIGDGPAREFIVNKIKKLGLDNDVYMLGFRNDIKKYYQVLDYLVMPSVREGLPYTLLEAMYLKIPVLATQVGDIPLVIENNKTGILIPPGNSSALSQAMSEMLSDSGKCLRFADQGYKRVNQFFSGEEMTRKTELLYEKLCLKRNRQKIIPGNHF